MIVFNSPFVLMLRHRLLPSLLLATALACGSSATTTPSAPSLGATSESDDSSPADDSTARLDIGADGSGSNAGDHDGPPMIDLLFVIDNSSSTAEEQTNLGRNLPGLVRQLETLTDGAGEPVDADVHILVTTTDMAYAHCGDDTSGQSLGRPVVTGCNERIDDFVNDTTEVDFAEACRQMCPTDIVPKDDRGYIWFGPKGNNLPDVDPIDVDGDGVDDSPAAQSLACLGLQGIRGCGYEAPLDAMMAALDPDAEHNKGDHPFVREDAMLAIVMLTDELDCSIDESAHPEVFDENGDREFWNLHPDLGTKRPSSAICWNAGVDCQGPNGKDEFINCESTPGPLVPVARYTDYFDDLLGEGKQIMMLGILGVPEVTAHDTEPPYLPIEGGIEEVTYRLWRDGPHPDGDLLPGSPSAEILSFIYGVGPGCTGGNAQSGFTGQALPPVRIKEVCQSLDGPHRDSVRCCIESICDDDFSSAVRCLTGLVGGAVPVE